MLRQGDKRENYSLIISVVPRVVETITILEDVDFSSGFPSGWSTSSTSGAKWYIGNPVVDDANETGGTGKYVWVNNNFQTTDTELLMLDVGGLDYNMTTYEGVYLKFKSHFVFDLFETANVDVSIDGGNIWTTVWQLQVFALGPSTHGINLGPVAAGEPTVRIRFRYETAGLSIGDLWQIDDVELSVSSSVIAGDTCGNDYHLPANQWRFISLPCDPGADSISDIFGDDLPAVYTEGWIMWDKDNASNQYNPILDINTPLEQGKGFYIYTFDSGLLDMTGTSIPPTNSADCSSADYNCYEIPLVKPVDMDSTFFNALGHPFPYPVNWAKFRIVDSLDPTTLMTPSDALSNNYLSKVVHKYTGSAFVPYDDVSPGYDHGALGAFDGFWVETLPGSLDPSVGDLTLLIPNTRSPGVITTASGPAATTESAAAAGKTDAKTEIPPGLAKRNAHRKRHRDARKKGEEWHVRLIVEAPAEELIDDGNVLGQLFDSSIELDEHDLLEQAPLIPYLTIIFPHEAWGENADEYTGDFHPVSANKVLDQWTFDVLSDDPAREVTLNWTGTDEVLGMSWLIDLDTGEVTEPDKRSSYSFVMNAKQRRFSWEYEKRPGNSGRKP